MTDVFIVLIQFWSRGVFFGTQALPKNRGAYVDDQNWHRSNRPVRPLAGTGQTGLFNMCQFWSSTYAPLFFGDACMPKNKSLDQNCLRTMINTHRPFFVLRMINSIGHILLLLQADDETTCLGLHTYFMVAVLAGTTSACCSMDSFLRIHCSLLFWV